MVSDQTTAMLTVDKSTITDDSHGVVYIIRHGDQRVYKVGKTSLGHVKQRLANLQVGNPIMLHLVCCTTYENALVLESRIHRYLAKFHIRGEWFNCPLQEIYKAVGMATMCAPSEVSRKHLHHGIQDVISNKKRPSCRSTNGNGEEDYNNEKDEGIDGVPAHREQLLQIQTGA